MTDELKISNDIKLKILQSFIEPSYTDDVDNLIRGKKCWRISGQVFETISKIFVAVGGIISFSSGYFSNPILGFVAGGISTISLALLQFSSFSYAENKKQSQELNIILKKLNVDTLPVFERNGNDINMSMKAQAVHSTESFEMAMKRYEEELRSRHQQIDSLANELNHQSQTFQLAQQEYEAEILKLKELLDSKEIPKDQSVTTV